MAENNSVGSALATTGLSVAGVVGLIWAKFPPQPALADFSTFRIVGLLFGLALGGLLLRYAVKRHDKRYTVFNILVCVISGIFDIIFVAVYLNIIKDVENKYWPTVVLFLLINILSAIVLVYALPFVISLAKIFGSSGDK